MTNSVNGVYIICYTNSAVNDLRALGFQNVQKLELHKVDSFAKWIDDGLVEVIVVKRYNERDYLQEVNKKKLHYVIDYFTDRFPESRVEELKIEIVHREKNYKKNQEKKLRKEQFWVDDECIYSDLQF